MWLLSVLRNTVRRKRVNKVGWHVHPAESFDEGDAIAVQAQSLELIESDMSDILQQGGFPVIASLKTKVHSCNKITFHSFICLIAYSVCSKFHSPYPSNNTVNTEPKIIFLQLIFLFIYLWDFVSKSFTNKQEQIMIFPIIKDFFFLLGTGNLSEILLYLIKHLIYFSFKSNYLQ